MEPKVPSGAPDKVVRIVTENGRILRFTTHGVREERTDRDSSSGRPIRSHRYNHVQGFSRRMNVGMVATQALGLDIR
jgi:hypothetical protein